MTEEVSVETLRGWLDQGRPVTVLDVRPLAERREWAIPGSLHRDVYERLKAGDPRALAGFEPPPGQPVITVCAAGKTSRIAAEQLRSQGIQALSLQGGMKAWSLAWNTAQVPLASGRARVVQVRRTGKGCLSYVIEFGGEALIIDASLPPEVYLGMASRITQVVETHIHADHLSRARELAARAGAALLVPEQNRVSFPFVPVRDGDRLAVGDVSIQALRTPGHTLESTCYLLDDALLFTGDTLFPRAVGRPDLHGAGETTERARLLYGSLQRLFELPAGILVLAGHAGEPVPFDGRPIAALLEQARLHADLSLDEFVASVLARIPPTPPNYERIIGYNEAGCSPDEDPTGLEAGANRCAIA
jgi:glyoxylase-like metal-dependent hydrolase (beta-lactamase superfamily II)/rhodanese-related sulfurtransferase